MVGLLTEVLLRGLPTRNDRLQEDRMLVLDERHEVRVVLVSDDEDALARVALGIRVLQNVEQVATLDVEHHVLESDAAVRPELRVFGLVPGEVLHRPSVAQRVLDRHTLASPPKCAQECAPERSPTTIIRQPTRTKV